MAERYPHLNFSQFLYLTNRKKLDVPSNINYLVSTAFYFILIYLITLENLPYCLKSQVSFSPGTIWKDQPHSKLRFMFKDIDLKLGHFKHVYHVKWFLDSIVRVIRSVFDWQVFVRSHLSGRIENVRGW